MPAVLKFHSALWREILLTDDHPDILRWSDDGQVLIIDDPPALLALCRNLNIAVTTFEGVARQLRNYHWRKLRGLDPSIPIGRQHLRAGSQVWKHAHLSATSTLADVDGIDRRLSPREALNKKHGNIRRASSVHSIKTRERSNELPNLPAGPDIAVPSEPTSTGTAHQAGSSLSPSSPGTAPSLGYGHSPSLFAASPIHATSEVLNIRGLSQGPKNVHLSLSEDIKDLPVLMNDSSSAVGSSSVWKKSTLFDSSSYGDWQASLWLQAYQASRDMEHACNISALETPDSSIMPSPDPSLAAEQRNIGSGKATNKNLTYSSTISSTTSPLYSSSAFIAAPHAVMASSRDAKQSLMAPNDLPTGTYTCNNQLMTAPSSSEWNFEPVCQKSVPFDFSDSGTVQGVPWSSDQPTDQLTDGGWLNGWKSGF